MAQWLKSLGALPKEPGLVPSTHTVSQLSLAPVPRACHFFWPPWTLCTCSTQTETQIKHVQTYNEISKIFKNRYLYG